MDGDGWDEARDTVALPGFASGGRVERTGIALVHEGEYIIPAEGSEAEITPDSRFDCPVIHYYFPVQLEVVGQLGDAQMRALAEYVFEQLQNALSSRI